MRTMMSVGSWIAGSGTSSMRTSLTPCQVSAFIVLTYPSVLAGNVGASDAELLRQSARRRARAPLDRLSPVRPAQRVGLGAAAGVRAESLPGGARLGRVRGLVSRADRRGERRDEGPLRVRVRRLPPPASLRVDRLSLPRRRVAPQGGRAVRARAD